MPPQALVVGRRRGVELPIETPPVLVERINRGLPAGTCLILHVTC